MSLFRRRKETLNERLMREAGIEPATLNDEPAEPHVADPLLRDRLLREAHMVPETGAPIIGAPRADGYATVEAPGIAGDRVAFVALPDGSLVVDDEQGDANLSPFADALERDVQPPYRASGARRDGDVWVLTANRIRVVELESEGDAIELAVHAGERTLTIDGRPSLRALPELERLGEREGPDYVVHAERLDGDLWEVRVAAL